MPHTCGRGLSVLGGGRDGLFAFCGASGLTVWAEAVLQMLMSVTDSRRQLKSDRKAYNCCCC